MCSDRIVEPVRSRKSFVEFIFHFALREAHRGGYALHKLPRRSPRWQLAAKN